MHAWQSVTTSVDALCLNCPFLSFCPRLSFLTGKIRRELSLLWVILKSDFSQWIRNPGTLWAMGDLTVVVRSIVLVSNNFPLVVLVFLKGKEKFWVTFYTNIQPHSPTELYWNGSQHFESYSRRNVCRFECYLVIIFTKFIVGNPLTEAVSATLIRCLVLDFIGCSWTNCISLTYLPCKKFWVQVVMRITCFQTCFDMLRIVSVILNPDARKTWFAHHWVGNGQGGK